MTALETSIGRHGDESPSPTTLDEARVEAFAEELFGHYTSGFVTLMVDLGHRVDLWAAASEGPATSQELAARAGLQERYVREWLGAVVTAGIVEYDASSAVYTLPQEHAVCLAGDSALNLAPLSQVTSHLGKFVEPVARAFREGGGVPYSAYRPEFTGVMDGLGRGTFDALLIDGIVPLTGALADRLPSGIRVADIGCGTGHTTNLLARAYPASTFLGYDLAEDALEHARDEAGSLGLGNVTFELLDVAQLPDEPPLDAAFAFDAIHDQVDPAGVLARVFRALVPGGTFVMFDIRASSHLENNIGNPMAPLLYSVSTLHCLTVSLAGGGAGLGTVWGEELALEMLAAAGFVDVEVHEAPGDPLDSVYVARTPG